MPGDSNRRPGSSDASRKEGTTYSGKSESSSKAYDVTKVTSQQHDKRSASDSSRRSGKNEEGERTKALSELDRIRKEAPGSVADAAYPAVNLLHKALGDRAAKGSHAIISSLENEFRKPATDENISALNKAEYDKWRNSPHTSPASRGLATPFVPPIRDAVVREGRAYNEAQRRYEQEQKKNPNGTPPSPSNPFNS